MRPRSTANCAPISRATAVASTCASWNYCVTFLLFRLAAIAQGVYRHGLAGNSSNPESIKMRKSACERAYPAWSLVC